jgi:hypothetical protein
VYGLRLAWRAGGAGMGAFNEQLGKANLTTKCFALTTYLQDGVQAVRSPYEAANMHSRGSFVGRWRITPMPLGWRG